MSAVSYQSIDNIVVLTINNPPVNALSHSLRSELLEAVQRAKSDTSTAIVLACDGGTFVAGADINEFGKAPRAPALAELLNAIESSSKPVVAAIHGAALGGGMELALACHYRCALVSAEIGFPEVSLGLIPGGGGTQRLPRLVGMDAAMEIISGGKQVSAGKACDLGLIDHVVDSNLLGEALIFAKSLAQWGARRERSFVRRTRDLTIDLSGISECYWRDKREALARRNSGNTAQAAIIDALEAAATLPFADGLDREREIFQECVKSPVSKAMRYQFFAERKAAKISGGGLPPRPVRRVAVVGAGMMGAGIAMCFADAGIPVTLLDISAATLGRGQEFIRKSYKTGVAKARLTDVEADTRIALIYGTLKYEDLCDADLVVEAVFESMEVKKQVFETLDKVCKQGAILASNTSYLDIDQLASYTCRPEDVIGMHFFSPANVMRLLEVVRTSRCSPEVHATVVKLAKRMGKIPVTVGVCYGFVGNRLFTAYVREAQNILLEGATPADIDAAMVEWGMAMGPFSTLDLAGLDIGYKARQSRGVLPDDPRHFHVGNVLVERGRLGQKSRAGFYRYEDGSREAHADKEVEQLIITEAGQLGIAQRKISRTEIVERLMYSIVNEGARLLEEGVALRADDIDVIMVNGYGFPRHRGGPLYFADSVGLREVRECIGEYYNQLGDDLWRPAPLLEKLVNEGAGFLL
ncbi:MAG TPA: 3-hydroxyacyl-CoA dehydrogenase [Spongiibacteraceae bacterium]|nr:3-hydroxyacyl-CoA dehydrogenase [Spongiibacteraceae bacterium]HCS26836.1 3-hydroxyacyl-CoA dehydrogenase [Spongiibacteraceae bacterium]